MKPMIAKAKELGYESLALADTMTISGMVEFTNQCKKAGIKPIVGVTLRVYDKPTEKVKDAVENREVRIKAFVMNEDGLKNLIRVLSNANTPERFYYNARVSWDDVKGLQGCVITTGDFQSVFSHPDYREKIEEWRGLHLDVLVEIVPINTPLWDTMNARAIDLAAYMNLPTIIGHPFLYANPEDAKSLDVRGAIQQNADISAPWLPKHWFRGFHMRKGVEIAEDAVALSKRLQAHHPGLNPPDTVVKIAEAIKSMGKVADLCTYEFKKMPLALPMMAAGGKDGEWAALKDLCTAGFKERLLKPILAYQPPKEKLPVYVERLKYELDVLKKMGFSGYFLLVRQIVNWSKSQGIIVGPGRGSVGGSLVAYLIGITDVDPIRFDLLFERFINPERIDLPDADLDFMSARRHEVIDHIIEQFGEEQVAGISNFTTMGAASSIRDVARIHGMAPYEYSCSKLMEKEHGVSLGLEESAAKVPDIEKFKNERPVIWDHALRLEGCMRGLGQHAAGVIIADQPVSNRAVVETRAKGRVANWDKKYVEDWGLIKIDILGLTTLDMLARARDYIKDRHGKDIDYLTVDLTDPKVLDAFAHADTTGVFQFESSGMRKLLKDLALGGALTFDDLVAVVALFRPGPLDAGLCDEYVQIKQGAKSPWYEHPNMEPALKKTFGVIVYQEQVMQIARDVAGFTMAEADHLRKAMGKKDADKMKEMREKFVKGCEAISSMPEHQATALWDKIEVFAGYAFNLSHSVEYSLISFLTMWVKVHYPAEFYAASMSIQDDNDRLAPLVMDARNKGINVLPPDVNGSLERIVIRSDKELLAPFQAIKGISENVANAIVKTREFVGGTFTDLPKQLEGEAQKAAGLPRAVVNSAHREKLDKVGAFYTVLGGKPPLDPTRLKDRLELMPGYTVESVKASRGIPTERAVTLKLLETIGQTRTCDKCSLKGGVHVMPRLGHTPKFMAIFDAPTYQEERAGKMLEGDGALFLKEALKEAGLTPNDGYYTSLIKSPKIGKGISNEQILGCSPYLAKEIEILKPPVILVLGSNTMRHLLPSIKGSMNDFAGKVVYNPDLDASIVIGINPLQVLFDDKKAVILQQVCEQVASLMP
jgi:DNA polymerase-3 subunit alpha